MPIWGWVCVGLVALVIVALALLVWIVGKQQARIMREGRTVVARIILANPSLYKPKPAAFEFAFVLFTRDADESEEHLAFLARIEEKLERFKPDGDDPDEGKLAWALETQRTVGRIIRVPDRVTGGRKVYFATPSVKREFLPEGKLTREYIYLRALVVAEGGDVLMVEYPDHPRVSNDSDDDE